MINLSINEILVVVTPKGESPDYIYEKGELVNVFNEQYSPYLSYNYGIVEGTNDSDEKENDRIIVSKRELKRNQRIKAYLTDLKIEVEDKAYPGKICVYRVSVDEQMILDLRLMVKEAMIGGLSYYYSLEQKGLMSNIKADWGFVRDSPTQRKFEELKEPSSLS